MVGADICGFIDATQVWFTLGVRPALPFKSAIQQALPLNC